MYFVSFHIPRLDANPTSFLASEMSFLTWKVTKSGQMAKTGGNKEFTQNFGGENSSENTKGEDR